jgi:hypothetical protein
MAKKGGKRPTKIWGFDWYDAKGHYRETFRSKKKYYQARGKVTNPGTIYDWTRSFFT